MAVSIKEEGMLLLDPPEDFVTTNPSLSLTGVPETEEVGPFDDLDEEQAEILKANGPPADIELEKLPRPVSSLNCRQARSYLVKLLRAANGGQNPQYGNPNSKPPFWPDYYWPWSKLTDVHTKPRGMEEPLLYSEMMKLAIQRGYKYYGYDPENYWDKTVEEKEPAPVERGTPAPILSHQVEKLGLPPRLPRPNSKLNCVQARTVLSKLLRYQQAGNNPVYGHPETRPPWWPDECIRWSDMVDLRGKPPYLPPDMTYTDVLKHAIEKGLEFFGYDAETWIDDAQYTREINHSLLAKKPVISVADNPTDGPPKLPVPINKMNCGLARTSLSRLLRYHCGKNPKYGTLNSMPVWWPNDVFEWTALKNLSHRYDGVLGDSYSNCLRMAIMAGYEHYNKDPYTYVEEIGEDLPTVASIKRIKPAVNPQVSELIQKFDDDIAEEEEEEEQEMPVGSEPDEDIDTSALEIKTESPTPTKPKRPPPPLIAIADIAPNNKAEVKKIDAPKEELKNSFVEIEKSKCFSEDLGNMTRDRGVKRKVFREGPYGPLLSGRAHTQPGTVGMLKRCRVDVDKMGLDQIADEPVSVSRSDLLEIARSACDSQLFERIKTLFNGGDKFADCEIVFSDGSLRVHRIVLAANSPYLHQLMLESDTDCLMFPDISLAQGKMGLEALYTGNVKIDRRSVMSLGCVEKCVRLFQQVGLLENYSIQISSLLPLENFKPTRSPTTRILSPPSSPEPSPPPSLQDSLQEPLQENENFAEAVPQMNKIEPIEPNQNELSVELEKGKMGEEDKKCDVVAKVESPKKKSSPTKTETVRKVCNKPRFSDINPEKIEEMEKKTAAEVISWLQENQFLSSVAPRCKGCGKMNQLQESQDVDGLSWKCPSRDKCVPGPVTPSLLREFSIFQYSKDKLLWIMKIINCWRENTSLSQCHQETNASIDQIFFWYEKCRQFFGQIDDENCDSKGDAD